jgi:hypothetical protein
VSEPTQGAAQAAPPDEIEAKYRKVARDDYHIEGQIEVDETAEVSVADDGTGAYVQCWMWIDAEEIEPGESELCECGRQPKDCATVDGGDYHQDRV